MTATRYTVLGASGFIGRHLVHRLKSADLEVMAPPRESSIIFSEDLGHVFYCIGLTADWRTRPLDAVHAHVGRLIEILERSRFSSLLYLSSTRVYKRVSDASEDAVLAAAPTAPDDLFDISKILGEAASLAHSKPTRVARISNVYGDDLVSKNFLSSIVRDALRGRIELQTSLQSAKDYVGVDELVEVLPRIATTGRHRVYNIAAGRNTSHGEIVDELARLTGCEVRVDDGAPTTSFPVISVDRVAREFQFSSRSVVPALAELVAHFQAHRGLWERS